MGVRSVACLSNPPGRQRGVALGIVVWFIAGMALLVSGIVSEARVDTRMAQLHYFRAQAAAAADGAINWLWPSKRACGPVAREVQIVCKIASWSPILSKFG